MEPLAAGYETAVFAGCDDLKRPPTTTGRTTWRETCDFGTVADGIRLSEAAIRRLA